MGSAAAKCSNQADLHLTFIDPIRHSDLRRRPQPTATQLATDQAVRVSARARKQTVLFVTARGR